METSTPANKHHLRFFVNPKQYNTRSLDRRKLRGHSSGSSSGKSSLVTINDNDILREKSETKTQPNLAVMETVMQPTMANYCTLRRRSSDLIKNKTKIEYISNVRLDFPSGSSGSSGRGHSNSSTSSSSTSTSSIKTDQPLQVSTTKSPTATSSTMQAGTTAATTKEHASELLPDQTNSDGLQDPAPPPPQREQHRVRKLVKSAELQALQEPSQSSIIQSLPEVVKSIHASIEEQSTSKCSQMNNKNAETTTDYTSDDDDLSHAEELSSFNEDSSSSTSNESLNSGGAGNLNVLPTGWHRHPHIHQVPAPSLGPVDEIIDDGAVEEDEDDDEDDDGLAEHIYSSVVKPPRGNPSASAASAVGGLIEAASSATGANRKPRFTSVLRSSRIMRRHTTYYNAKQFDSLPPQGTNSSMIMSTSSSSASSCQRKPHVHSWHHRHRHHEKHSISNSNSSPNNSNNNSLHQVGPGISILELSGGAGMIFF